MFKSIVLAVNLETLEERVTRNMKITRHIVPDPFFVDTKGMIF